MACAKEGLTDTDYLYYALKNVAVELKEKAHGAVFSTIIKDTFSLITIPIWSIPEQRRIAHILGTLDDKIENNRKTAKTLEAMAQAIFKSWFVDFDPVRARMAGESRESICKRLKITPEILDLFPDRLVESELGEIPEGWDLGTLSKFFKVGLGGVWGNDAATLKANVAIRCLRGTDCHDLAEGRIPEVPLRWITPNQAADRLLSKGTILIEGSGSFCGRSMIWNSDYENLFSEPVGYSNFCKRLDPLCGVGQAMVCWMQIRKAYREGIIQTFRTGTAFPNLDVHDLVTNLIVVVPTEAIANTFGKIFELSQRIDLMTYSLILVVLRDNLLPKLISGEIRVPDAEHLVETSEA